MRMRLWLRLSNSDCCRYRIQGGDDVDLTATEQAVSSAPVIAVDFDVAIDIAVLSISKLRQC
jgi:hypothetical protein